PAPPPLPPPSFCSTFCADISRQLWLSGMISWLFGWLYDEAGQLWPPSVLGQPCTHTPNFCSRMSARYVGRPVFGSKLSHTFWKTVSLWPRYLPVLRSSFHSTPSLPTVNSRFCPLSSTSTRSKTM